jgi:Trypsin-like peptidase domain
MKRSVGLLFAILLLPLIVQAQVRAYDFSALYEVACPAVVQITTDDGAGSGFLVSPFGHIATNFHVIRNSRYLAVQFQDGRKVKADVIAVNAKYDMALLKVNSSVVRNLHPLQLLPEDKETAIRVGIPVVALGSPFNQKFMMTQGILSKVDEDTLLGDFLLQAGNSGGPLLDIDGQVIGINTFGESNIAGAVRISTLRDLLNTEGIWDSIAVEPSPELLPTLSDFRYPIEILNAKIQTEPLNGKAYQFHAGEFNITAITPVLVGKMQAASGMMREINRYARRSQYIEDSKFQPGVDPYYEWHRTTESALEYAITFDIRPVSGPVKRGRFSTILKSPLSVVGKSVKRDMEFKGEFMELRIYRDGRLIEPVTPGRQMILGKPDDQHRFVDEAYAGSYIYSPDEFMTGNEFRFQVIDAREPKKIHKEVIFHSGDPLIRQIRHDFSYSSDFFFVKAP